MKTELLSVRLPKDNTAVLEEIVKEEQSDKTAALKKLLALGAKKYKLEKAVAQYQAGKISVGRASELAGISLWELMEELKARNISARLDKNDYQQSRRNLAKTWK